MKLLHKYALYLAWIIALVGFFVSLYFGEVSGKEPCHLCWYQRVALFPIVLLLGNATYKEDRHIVVYAMPLVILGGLFALYQIVGVWFPFLQGHAVCGYTDECADPVFKLFGFLTLPMV